MTVTSAPAWSVLVLPFILAGFALVAAAADHALAAHAARRRLLPALAGPLTETTRLLVAQRRTTPAPDTVLWRIGLASVPIAALLAAAVVPLGGWTASDLDVGVVWFNAMEVLTWVGMWLAGWGPNAVFPLVGGYRFLAQALAYELPLMFALICAATGAESLRVGDIVEAQRDLWFVTWMPVAFLVHLAGVTAFAFFGPFAYPVGRDIAGGALGALAGPDRLLLAAGRWMLLTVGAAMAVPLFLGGGGGPLLPAWLWTVVKTLAVLALLVWCGRRLPAVRADRYTELAWLVLLPAAILQTLAAAVVVLNR